MITLYTKYSVKFPEKVKMIKIDEFSWRIVVQRLMDDEKRQLPKPSSYFHAISPAVIDAQYQIQGAVHTYIVSLHTYFPSLLSLVIPAVDDTEFLPETPS